MSQLIYTVETKSHVKLRKILSHVKLRKMRSKFEICFVLNHNWTIFISIGSNWFFLIGRVYCSSLEHYSTAINCRDFTRKKNLLISSAAVKMWMNHLEPTPPLFVRNIFGQFVKLTFKFIPFYLNSTNFQFGQNLKNGANIEMFWNLLKKIAPKTNTKNKSNNYIYYLL